MFQKQIYSNLAAGVEGEYADDSPRRETPYILLSNTTQTAAAAKGALAFTANPADGDTVTIGSVIYRFKQIWHRLMILKSVQLLPTLLTH